MYEGVVGNVAGIGTVMRSGMADQDNVTGTAADQGSPKINGA